MNVKLEKPLYIDNLILWILTDLSINGIFKIMYHLWFMHANYSLLYFVFKIIGSPTELLNFQREICITVCRLSLCIQNDHDISQKLIFDLNNINVSRTIFIRNEPHWNCIPWSQTQCLFINCFCRHCIKLSTDNSFDSTPFICDQSMY